METRTGITSTRKRWLAWSLAIPLAGAAAAQTVHEQVTLSGPGASDQFGFSVALDGDQLLVGAPQRAQPWGPIAGAVFPFRRLANGTWQQAGNEWTPLDASAYDRFGQSVDLSGDLAIVGAEWADGVGAGDGPGAAYVFHDLGGPTPLWQQIAKVDPAPGSAGERFGFRAAISGQIAVVGAPMESGGAFYAFERDLGGANAFGESKHVIQQVSDQVFAHAVAIDGGWAFVGRCRWLWEASPATQGSVWIYQWGGVGTWTQHSIVGPPVPEPSEAFGASLATTRTGGPTADTWVAVGAPSFDSGKNGSVYVFKKSLLGTNWTFVARIQPPEPPGHDRSFGFSLAFDGRELVIGAGPPSGTSAQYHVGSAWIYRRTGVQFEAVARFTPEDSQPLDAVGRSVAISGDWIAVGANEAVHLLRVPLFADGFEPGSTIRWSFVQF